MEADISIWQKPGHFYFALTVYARALAAPGDYKRGGPTFFNIAPAGRFGAGVKNPASVGTVAVSHCCANVH
jgi:hypothetical protein